MDRDRINKLIELNQVYHRLPEGNHWELSREDLKQDLFFTLIKIGRGVYQPKESEIRKYNLIRKFFLVEIWEKVYLTTGYLMETDNMNIYTDEAIKLGQNILTLKKLLGIPSQKTNFEIFQNNNLKIWIESKFIHPKNLDLQIGSYELKFCYGLNSQQEVVLLYCPRCNNRSFYKFEGADPLLKQLNDKYIFKLIENYDKLSARITSTDNNQNESSDMETSDNNTVVVPFQKKRRANFRSMSKTS